MPSLKNIFPWIAICGGQWQMVVNIIRGMEIPIWWFRLVAFAIQFKMIENFSVYTTKFHFIKNVFMLFTKQVEYVQNTFQFLWFHKKIESICTAYCKSPTFAKILIHPMCYPLVVQLWPYRLLRFIQLFWLHHSTMWTYFHAMNIFEVMYWILVWLLIYFILGSTCFAGTS